MGRAGFSLRAIAGSETFAYVDAKGEQLENEVLQVLFLSLCDAI